MTTRLILLASLVFLFAGIASVVRGQDTARTPSAIVVDYSMLAGSDVAASLKLTVEQQASVAQILAERDTAMGTADESTKPLIISAAADKLKALLTEDQRRLFATLFTGKTLRFNFRNQKWAEVLDWIAKEADLSLVMETVPPGTFSYSDARNYSVSESIDLINGWLLTKGFTLVRRERMLMCLDLKGGLPEGAVPQVAVEELQTRSRFEFVSVLLALEGRTPETVLAEIKPLLGTYGKAESLPQTKQLLVYDTVQALRIIQDIVKKVPVVASPAPAPVAPAPSLVVYPIQHSNPSQAGEVLKQIVNGTIVVDAKAMQISVNAIPAEHEKAKIIIGQLESNQGPDQQPKLQLYSVRVSDADQMLATLKLIAPDGQYRIDPLSGKLVVWAAERDQQRVSESLETLQAEQPNGGLRQLQVYPLRTTEPTTLSTLLTTMAPAARITINSAARSLIVLATPADHEIIRTLVEQIETQAVAPGTQKELRTYPAKTGISSAAVTMLATIVPTAQVLADTPNQRLLVMAAESEHERVALLLKSLEAAADTGRELRLYKADRLDATSVTSLLASLVPQASVTSDAVNRRLVVMASESDHAEIQKVLEQVQLPDGESVPALKSYPLQARTTSATIVTLLASLVPRASVSVDDVNRRLLITATEKEHALIAQVIEQVEKDAGRAQPELRFYRLDKVNGTSSLSVLQTIVPAAKFTYLTEGNRFSVLATAEEHTAVAKTLEQLEANAADIQRSLRFYDVGVLGATDARTLLTTAFVDVSFVPTADGGKLMAWASDTRHTEILAMLEQLTREQPFKAGKTLKLYSIADLGPSASTVLSAAVPAASISAGARPDQLAIVATPTDHEKLTVVLEQLQGARAAPRDKTLTVHALNGVSPSSVVQILQPLVDADVQLTVDPGGKQIFIRAVAEKQDEIARVIAQVTQSVGGRSGLETRTYVVGAPNADEAQEVLVALFRDATIVTDADRKLVVATATPEQHETIQKICEQMRGQAIDGAVPVAEVYALKNVSATEVQTLLQSMYSRFDGVRLSVNEKTGRLIVLATSDQHKAIRPLVEQLDERPADAPPQELAVFRLSQLDPIAAQTALAPLLPKDAQATADRIGRQLFVSASSEEMPNVRKLVEQMLASQGATAGLVTRTYRLRPFEADEAMEIAGSMFPSGTFVTDTSQEILVATATEEQHATLLKIVEEMTSTTPEKNAPEARAYRLSGVDGDNAVDVLENLFRRTDNVRASYDEESRSLVAVARPDQHDVIQRFLDQLQPGREQHQASRLEIYPLPGIDGETAIEVAEGVLQSVDSGARIVWEKTSQQLIVTTTNEGHLAVEAAVQRFQENDPREMDVMQLRILSASAAQNAIEGLYGDKFSKSGDYPVIQADEDLQQLLVRGSKKQLQDIRSLLVKMGETGLTADTAVAAASGGAHLRVIPLTGDVESAVRRIEDLWPRVRRNKIRVLRPGPFNQTLENSADPSPSTVPPDEKTPGPEPPKAQDGTGFVLPDAHRAIPVWLTQESEPQVSPPTGSIGEPSPSFQPPQLASETQSQSDGTAEVVIVTGPDRVTIASEDLEALDQLEAIFRATTSRTSDATIGARNRDFSVYQLRNAGAEEVAETLDEIYNSRAGVLAFGSVVIVPEPRMNALIVYGGRTDRDRIEQLLEILDTEKLPDSGRIFRTHVIPVRHADANKLEVVLRGVYRTEMAAGGSRRAIEIPSGIDSSVASVLRQINAAASAPLLTIEVQDETNSLVVKAPQNLIDEIEELVTELDDTSATNRSRGVTLIPLKKTNSRRVMEVLKDVLE